ncbi:MAG: PfkB family carbohydrate kinase, partial [Ilumatobacteraceae bacterium]
MTAPAGPALELITVGRICVDLYANEAGASFVDPQTFTKSIGGSATNVAIAAARLGHRAAVFTKVGDDPFGVYVRHKLDLFGVDTRYVSTHPSMPTPLAFAAMDPPDDPKLLMYRYPIGPDQTLGIDEIDRQAVVDVPVLWLTGAWFSKEPARATCWELLSIRQRKPHVVFDLDYRANFWPSPEAAAGDIGPVLDHVTVAVGNRVECEVAVGSSDPPEAARRLLARGVELAIVK